MMASLYHEPIGRRSRGQSSLGITPAVRFCRRRCRAAERSPPAIPFSSMRCCLPRQRIVVAFSRSRTGYERRGSRPHSSNGSSTTPRPRAPRVQVHDHEHDVPGVVSALAVGDDLLVIDGMEAKVIVRLQSRVLSPDGVNLRDDAPEAVFPIDVPALAVRTSLS